MGRCLQQTFLLFAALSLCSCASDTIPLNDSVSAEVYKETCIPSSFVPNEACLFDASLEDGDVGASAGNFCFPEQKDGDFWLHKFCGKQDLVWLIMSSGWCIPCQEHAPYIDTVYQKYKDQGLVVVWVIGETLDYAPPTTIAVDKFIAARGVTFPVVFDYRFKNVYKKLDPLGSSLPHMYLLDGQTMELLAKQTSLGFPIEEMIVNRYEESDEVE